MSRGVNDAIDAGIAKGLITSTNVMTNMELYEEAAKLRQTGASVGLHWTVSAGKPVCSKEEIPTLVDENGAFYPYAQFRARYRKGEIADADIVKELKAQYARFVAVCGEPDYWNTHQNTHVDFKIFQLFVKVAEELGITKMRSHRRLYIPSSVGGGTMPLKWKLLEPVKRMILNGWTRFAEKHGMSAPAGIAVPLRADDLKDPAYAFSHLEQPIGVVAEYVIHPSTALDSPYFGTIGEKRLEEYAQFVSDEQAAIFAENGYQLVNFDEI